MSKPTLLAELYHLLLDSRVVHFADLEARFPNEFRAGRASGFCADRASMDAHAEPPMLEGSMLGRRQMSEAMKDAVCFLIAEDFVDLLPGGSLVRRRALAERTDAVSPWHAYSAVACGPTARN